MRLIGSFVYIIEPLSAPRAAVGQPKGSQELQEQPLASQEAPKGQFPNLIEKPYKSHETSLKKSKKHRARAQSGSQVPRIAVKSSFLELEPDLPDPAELVPELRLGPSVPRAPVVRMTVVKTNSLKIEVCFWHTGLFSFWYCQLCLPVFRTILLGDKSFPLFSATLVFGNMNF